MRPVRLTEHLGMCVHLCINKGAASGVCLGQLASVPGLTVLRCCLLLLLLQGEYSCDSISKLPREQQCSFIRDKCQSGVQGCSTQL
jgi:hypothetical protein